MDRWLEWFRSQRTDTQAVIVAFALLVAVVASPVLRWVSLLVLIAVVIALILRAVQRTPVRHLVIPAVALLVAFFVFDALASAIYGPLSGGGSERAKRERAPESQPSEAEERTGLLPDVPTPEPAADGREQAEPAPEPPPKLVEPQRPTTIKGLGAVDVYGNLEDQGLGCRGPIMGVSLAHWQCEGTDGLSQLHVEISGESATQITSVEADVTSPSKNDVLAADFLGYVATIPYRGSRPHEAQSWVESKIGEVDTGVSREKTIGSVKFRLYGPPTARILEIHGV